MLLLLIENVAARWREWRVQRALEEVPHATARRLLLSQAPRDAVR